jgi:hypothetical protein
MVLKIWIKGFDLKTFLICFLFEAWEQMLKFIGVQRQEINLVFKIKVFVGSKIWYFNKFYLFLNFQKFGLLHGGSRILDGRY